MHCEDDRKLTEHFIELLLSLDRIAAEKMLITIFKESGLDGVARILIVPALEWIGNEWVAGKVSLSELYMSSKICEELIRLPSIPEPQIKKRQPKIAIAALLDYHFLGKKMVQMVLHSQGYDVLDYGQGISVDELVAQVAKGQTIDILLISTLMLPSALKVKSLREKLNEAGLTKIKIVVGGAPFRFDKDLWRKVDADAVGMTASDALAIVESLSKEVSRGKISAKS